MRFPNHAQRKRKKAICLAQGIENPLHSVQANISVKPEYSVSKLQSDDFGIHTTLSDVFMNAAHRRAVGVERDQHQVWSGG